MKTTLRSWAGLLCTAAIAAGAWGSAQALSVCAAPPTPESRASNFDARLFERNGAELSISGQSQLAAFAQALEPASLEVVVISVPHSIWGDTEVPRELAMERAETVKRQLMKRGVPRERIYVEQRSTTLPARLAMETPLTIETIAAWPQARNVAGGKGWRCIA